MQFALKLKIEILIATLFEILTVIITSFFTEISGGDSSRLCFCNIDNDSHRLKYLAV